MEIRSRLLARNTALNFISLVLVGFAAIFCIPIIIRGLGPEAFGIFSLALVIVNYFSLFDLGLGRATTKFVSESLARRDSLEQLPRIVWTSLGCQLVLGTVGGVVIAGASSFLSRSVFNVPANLVGDAEATFLILGFFVPVGMGTTTLRGALEASQRFDLVNIVKVPANAATFVVPAIGVSLGFGLPAVMLGVVVARFLAALAYLGFCLRVFVSLRRKLTFDSTMLRPLLSFGSWVAVSNVVGPILVYVDRILIGSLFSVAFVAYYTAPYELATAFWILPTSLVATLFPAFSAMGLSSDRSMIEKVYVRSLKALLLTVGPLMLLLAFFARDILRLWLGSAFAEHGTEVLQILAIGVLINSLSWIPLSLLMGLGRPDLPAKFHLLELLFYPGLAWLLVREFGIVGAALAWTARVLVDAVLLLAACVWVRFVSLRAYAKNGLLRGVLALSVLALAFLLTVVATRAAILFQAGLAALLLALFALAAWSYVLDSGERNFLKAAVGHVVGWGAAAR